MTVFPAANEVNKNCKSNAKNSARLIQHKADLRPEQNRRKGGRHKNKSQMRRKSTGRRPAVKPRGRDWGQFCPPRYFLPPDRCGRSAGSSQAGVFVLGMPHMDGSKHHRKNDVFCGHKTAGKDQASTRGHTRTKAAVNAQSNERIITDGGGHKSHPSTTSIRLADTGGDRRP